MKVLLAVPPRDPRKNYNCMPPLGLGYLAAALRKDRHEVGLIDAPREELNNARFVEKLRQFGPDVLGLSVFSQDVPDVHRLVTAVRKELQGLWIVVGGAHPSGVVSDVFSHLGDIDFAFRGEAEIGFPALLKRLANSGASDSFADICGLIYRDGESIRANDPTFYPNLDELAFPAWDLMDPRGYPVAPQGMVFRQRPIAPIVTTRGCPFPCTFCAGFTISGRKIRSRSLDNVFDELHLLHDQYGVREVTILDDNFTFKRDWAEGFCRRLMSEIPDLTWCCPNGIRLDTLDENLVKLMKKSGCYYLSVGIETGSPRIMKLMKKKIKLDVVEEKVGMASRAGLDVNGFFILGFPGEKKEDMEMTIELALRLPLKRAMFFNFLPLPGTEALKYIRREGRGNEISGWENFFQTDIAYTPAGITKDDLKGFQKKAVRKFYLRPQTAWNLLREIKSPSQFSFLWRRLKALLGWT